MKPLAVGVVAGAAAGGVVAVASRGETLVPWPGRVRIAFPFVLAGVSGKVVALDVGLTASALRAASGRGRSPRVVPCALAAGAAVAFAVAGRVAGRRMLAKLEQQGRGIDAGFATAPTSPDVCAGPGSAVQLTELGREGARFVGTVSTPDEIREVTGLEPVASPVRVFIGLDTAPTPEQRVDLAIAELRRTNAFDRAHLLIQSPAGTGYANSTPVDVLEVLTLGDSASVAVAYGLLPSFLSLNKVDLAQHTQRLLLDAILAELSTRTTRPRLLLYGESLGAKVQEYAIPEGPAALDRYGISAALWVGTPGGAQADQFHALCANQSITIDRPEQIPAQFPDGRPRVWFLEHDGDPVVRFRPDLIANRPAWLPTDGSRGRNIPATMTWKPGITWAQVLVDTLFATNVKAGEFTSEGHDYRADLGATVTAAFDLPAAGDIPARLEAYLRRTEVLRAERIGEA